MTTNFRPPSVPLVTVDPYFSIWSAADHLYDDHTKHWTNKRNGMVGLIHIDGKIRRFMGRNNMYTQQAEPDIIPQTKLQIDPLTTTYSFEGDGIALEVQFTTPLLMDDLELLSRPVTYVTFQTYAVDGESHDVKIYLDITGEACVHTPDQVVSWNRDFIGQKLSVLSMGTVEQPILKLVGDDTRIDWGYLTLATKQAAHIKTVISSHEIRKQFIQMGTIPDTDDTNKPRAALDQMPVMAAVIDMGQVGVTKQSEFVMLAYNDVYSVEYFQTRLEPYWRRTGITFHEMLLSSAQEYEQVLDKCAQFNQQLNAESLVAGGQKYRDILALTYRQAVAAHKVVEDKEGEVLFFSKENFSNGCIATVDVSYPSIPLFLKYNTELIKGMMRPIFEYAENEEWKFEFAPHDVGTYPKANGQVYGENKLEFQMPIEECGNMLIMAAAICRYEGNADYVKANWKLLTQWAKYLLDNGLDPENQLCTDDFAGHLAHNTNLSIKAIIGIGAYAYMSSMLGCSESNVYRSAAEKMAKQWVDMARGGDHYKLTFDSSEDTWSMKYNLVWDCLLGLHLFPENVREKELEFYIAKMNKYGTPLDSRDTYTKADWLVWCASMSSTPAQFEQLISPLWDFINETSSRVPVTDWYDTITGKQMNFQNRSVVGGFFIHLLK